MNSELKKEFDAWVERKYQRLLELASRYVSEPADLVAHCYERIVRAAPPRIMDNPAGYWHRTMYQEATRGKYKRMSALSDAPLYDIPIEEDISELLRREQLRVWCDMLHPFDRVLLLLYLDGWNMAEVARGTGIPASTIKTSIHRSKLKLHAVTRNQ